MKINYTARNLFYFLSMEEMHKSCLRNVFAPQYSKRQIQNTRPYLHPNPERESRSTPEKLLSAGLCECCRKVWPGRASSTRSPSVPLSPHCCPQHPSVTNSGNTIFFFCQNICLVTYVQHIIRMS